MLYKIDFVFLYFFSLVSTLAHSLNIKSYEGCQVWRTVLNNTDEYNFFNDLHTKSEISLWKLTSKKVEYLVQSENRLTVHNKLKKKNLDHLVLMYDVAKKINKSDVLTNEMWNKNALRIGHRLDWKSYPTLKIIDEYLESLVQSYPSLCKVFSLGTTEEFRKIKMLTISNGNPHNKVFVMVAGVHAREWAGITSVLYIANDIASKYDEQPDYMKDKDWYIIPVLNPDGFAYSQSKDRLWKKNRRQFGKCYGVDINRNFGTDWVSNKGVDDDCERTFSGAFPFSEPESIALRDMILNSKRKPAAFIDFHSYGQNIVYPWSARNEHTPHNSTLLKTAKGMSEAISKSSNKHYEIGPFHKLLHPIHGASIDWTYNAGVTHSYIIETRDDGEHGFLLPAEKIEGTAKDGLIAVQYLAGVLGKNSGDKSWI